MDNDTILVDLKNKRKAYHVTTHKIGSVNKQLTYFCQWESDFYSYLFVSLNYRVFTNKLFFTKSIRKIPDCEKNTALTTTRNKLKLFCSGGSLQAQDCLLLLFILKCLRYSQNPDLNISTRHRTTSGKKSSYVRRKLLDNGHSCPAGS